MTVLDVPTAGSPAHLAPVEQTPPKVGPNAIIQTRTALDELAGSDARRAIFGAAGLERFTDTDPDAMVDAGIVNALNRQIAARLDAKTADAVMKRAGELTGDYILANRIPKAAQWLLKHLPSDVAQRVLLAAIARNAWTFAGNARVDKGPDFIAIHDNPICLGRNGFSSCIWHAAVFRRLFQTLVDPAITIHETECAGRGGRMCRFEIVRV